MHFWNRFFSKIEVKCKTYIDEFVIAAKKSRFWVNCIPKIEVFAFYHVSKIIYCYSFCAIFGFFFSFCTFVWLNCYCFVRLCLNIWILKISDWANLKVTIRGKKTYPLCRRGSCHWLNWTRCLRWPWCRSSKPVVFCRWFLCWRRLTHSRITNL